ncbi:MAG TPA: glycosyltransferase [Actinomycetota bacterium]|nr:glycosyltransferase [Actinomycetota bacterium]
MTIERIRHPQKLGDRLGAPDAVQASFVVLFDGWVEDLERLHASAVAHLGPRDWELVVVDNPVDDAASERIAGLERVTHLPLRDQLGWAAGRNLGLRQATGRIAIVVDTSVELTGDVLGPIEDHLDDPGVGLVGRWGVSSAHGFHFEESDGPDVDGVEAYLMAVRRADLQRTGLFNPKFKWYRNADLDFSFQVRDAGLRTIVDQTLPLERHTHRLWESTPEAMRDEQSRKNFFRFRDHWGDRRDLFLATE